MKKHSFIGISIIMAIVALFYPSQRLSANPYSIKLSLDSAQILMGKQTTLHVEMSMPRESDAYLSLPNDTLTKDVEIARILEADTTKAKGDGPMLVKQDIVIQSFDSGLYPIGPLALVTANRDTIFSNLLSLKVNPVNIDTLQTIHSFAPVMNADSRWWDFLPDWLIDYWVFCLIALLVILVGIYVWLFLKKKVTVPFVPKAKPVSPYDAALASLDNLRDKHLCENGMEKEYYTDLTDILRQYLDGRFGINAMEMTSSQILNRLDNHPEIKQHHDLVARVLEIADYVKFAKVRPLPDDNVAAWNNARQFVVDTKPAPEPQETEGGAQETQTPKK